MSRRNKDELETLRQAAQAVPSLLAKLERQAAELNARIARLRAVEEAYEAAAGKRPRARRGASGVASGNGISPERAKRGQALAHIEAVLREAGELEEPELRSRIAERFGIKYGRTTVYSALDRGKGVRFEQHERRWRLKA